ncbi:glycosyltransferase family 4 protein [Thalassobius sp. Cn5-15]|uniref:glycosyltransferase family 4 protein n=1 Tax=Thalassobius sp. Cn5-15 TaxID=2917763 RepID=UPI001EF2CE3D|nr:glycosyltransferase family 4 protein [Thalassobius sp. Cn5-15]MCG7495020.1 glycosyltransferase family 4 protein [Thalassobius sp. Cn5-15]
MHVLLTGNTTFKIANFREGLLKKLIEDHHKVTVLSPSDNYVSKIKELGAEHKEIRMDRNGISPLREFLLLFSIFMYIRQIRPEIVFSYTIKNNIYSGIACRILNIPFAPNVTGLGPAFDKKGLFSSLIRLLYRVSASRAMVVFFQNPDDLKTCVSAGIVPKERARLLPGSGVDLMRFQKAELPSADDRVIFLMVARLLWSKGVGQFVEAAEEIRKNHPNAIFRILGPIDHDSKDSVQLADVDNWSDEGIVEYLGVTENVLPHLYEAHCVVLPSYYREGTPRSLIEASAIGRPVITTNIPGCRDLVVNGETGILVKPKDAASLAIACIEFLGMSQYDRNAMGQKGAERVATHYDEKIVINSYIDLFGKI